MATYQSISLPPHTQEGDMFRILGERKNFISYYQKIQAYQMCDNKELAV